MSSEKERKQAVPIKENSEHLGQVKQRGQVEQHTHIEQVGQHEQWASDDHDGLSERPTAALLLLVLGRYRSFMAFIFN